MTDLFSYIKDLELADWGAIAAILAVVGGFIAFCYKVINIAFRNIKQKKEHKKKLEKRMNDLLIGLSINNADGDNLTLDLISSPNFIQTMGQKAPPHDADLQESWKDQKTNNLSVNDVERYPLVDVLFNDFFSDRKSLVKKHYLILGGSGMGKTTFLASFIYKYFHNNNYFDYKSREEPPYPIYVLKFEYKNILERLCSLTDYNSILLLEALDENQEASDDLGGFMQKLLPIIAQFKYVVITCRTQLFKNKDEEIEQLINKQVAIGNNVPFNKYYISPFTPQESTRFLAQKFKNEKDNLSKAKEIMDQSGDVMARPLILTYINDLLDISTLRVKLSDTDIYITIIEKWIIRECGARKDEMKRMYSLSKKIALRIYEKWLDSDEAKITLKEYQEFMKDCGYQKTNAYSFSQRSLLNRDSNGNIKFSHRSFWEMFMAIISIENPGMKIAPLGLEMAAKFSREIFKIQMNGETYSSINYYNPSNDTLNLKLVSGFSESIIDETIVKCNSDIENNGDVGILLKDVYALLLLLIQRYTFHGICYLKMISILKKKNNNMTCEQILQNLEKKGAFSGEYLMSLLSSILCLRLEIPDDIRLYARTVFDKIIYDSIKKVRIIDERFNYETYVTESDNGFTDQELEIFNSVRGSFEKNKDYIVYPNVYGFKADDTKTAIPKYLVLLGHGICEDDAVVYAIRNLLKESSRYITICLYRDATDTSEVVPFVQRILTDKVIQNYLLTQLIIIRITINEKTIYYPIVKSSYYMKNSNYNIKSILDHMLEFGQ